MIEFGKTLRLAREEKGYTISQLAEMTRMIHQTIEDLENENFTRIAAPIYGRGFVKLYCEAVGLDPKPMVAEFMEIFNGNRELGIKERAPAPAPAKESIVERTEDVPMPEPIAPEPPHRPLFDPIQPEPEPAKPEPPPAPAVQPKATLPETESGRPAQEHRLSRYASPLREASLPSLPSVPPTVWRIAALGIGALVLLWLLGLGFKALYNATSGAEPADQAQTSVAPQETETERQTVKPESADLAANTAGNREKIEVPPLYVD